MTAHPQKIAQYLTEAHATETTLVSVLAEQIAVAPRGEFRSALEDHLRETREHVRRLEQRLGQIDGGLHPLQAVSGLAQSLVGQALALAKTPIDLVRGSGGEEKVLKNAKDACATEALEIAMYLALEQLARGYGDAQTAELAAAIRGEEERMLERLREVIPALTDDVAAAADGEGRYEPARTGAADKVREISQASGRRARNGARQARKVPGVARAEGEIKGAVASQSELPIARYDSLSARDVGAKLTGLSQIDLGKIDAYERRHQNRSTVLERIDSLRGDEPWPGYDEQTVSEIEKVLTKGDADLAGRVRAYERIHKNRTGIVRAADRRSASN